jgi:hypothetical protein
MAMGRLRWGRGGGVATSGGVASSRLLFHAHSSLASRFAVTFSRAALAASNAPDSPSELQSPVSLHVLLAALLTRLIRFEILTRFGTYMLSRA